MLLYFSATLFVSATLLFLVQPMVGKMILPQLGGTPAVWNTCMVFFQAVLLVGYGYTHLLTTTQPTKRQVMIHCGLLILPFVLFRLPFELGNWEPPTDINPIFHLMAKLTLMVGLPFMAVSTTAPLLQKWFIHTDDPAAKDPYFLYGASNFGSMLGLAAYPTLVEPWLPVAPGENESTIQTQVHLWTLGYAIFVALVVGCAYVVWQALARKGDTANIPAPAPLPASEPKPVPAPAAATAITSSPKRRGAKIATAPATSTVASTPDITAENVPNDDITLLRRLRWIGLAAAPSSLMLGVTTYMTTDIAAVAFFWIVPLAMYLATFIFVFARWPWVWTGTPHTIVMFLQPCALLFLVLKLIANLSPPTWAEFLLHLCAFFTTTLMCHGELAKDRPSVKHLTEFYFWMSLGGVLGGLFNALFSPIVFQHGIWEYPIAMAFACCLRSNLVDTPQTLIPGDTTAERPTPLGWSLDFAVPVVMGLIGYGMVYVGDNYNDKFFLLRRSYLLAVMVVAVLALSLRPLRFGLSVAALFLGIGLYDRLNDQLSYEGRGFFGLLRVRDQNQGVPFIANEQIAKREWKTYRTLIHGGINHGRQITRVLDDKAVEAWIAEHGHVRLEDFSNIKIDEALTLRKRREPITYFHERNGVAEIYYKLSWPNEQPPTEIRNMTGMSDSRMAAAMVGLACGQDAALAMAANTQSEPPFAVLGLGTGLLASYAKPYQVVDFYEIDPLVKDMSIVKGYVPPWHSDRHNMGKLNDPTFWFLQDAQERWANLSVKLGDGRLVMKNEKNREKYYHIISLDAFSSDAIPVHLLTEEAVKLYLSNLADGGVLIFNTTNRFVRIEPVLSGIAKKLDLECLYCADWTSDLHDHPDRYSADWVALRRKTPEGWSGNGGRPLAERLLAKRKLLRWNGEPYTNSRGDDEELRWHEVAPLPGPVWTDGHSNLLKIMKWK